jgi:YggT family protein
MPESASAALWAVAVVNYLLAAVGYTLLGRLLLSFFVPPDWDNYIWRFFRLITDPALALTRRITPAFVPDPMLPLVAFFWTMVARCTILHGDALWVVVTHPSPGTLAVWLYLLSRCIMDIVLVDLGLLAG